MASMTISPVVAAENMVRAHEPGMPSPLGVFARLSMAAAALSLTIAAALSLIICCAAGLANSDGGPVTAVGLAAAGIVSGCVFLRVRR